MSEIAFLDGEILPIAEAKVSVNDRGFLFGDGVYEVVRTYAGRVWALEPHLRRLARSMREIQLGEPGIDVVRSRVTDTYQRSELPEAHIYIQITRGVAPRSHAFPSVVRPSFLVTVRQVEVPALADRERGVRIITVPEVRWGRCDIKSVNLLPNVLAKQAAKSRGAYEAVFVRSDGLVTEGSSTNVFIVKDGRIITREEGPHILSGITRGIVLEIAASRKIPCREGHLKLEDVLRADEVFLTGTTSEIMFVVGVNDVVIGSGAPGRIARLLYDAYRRRIDEASG